MAQVYPFRAVEYGESMGRDLSHLIAPPYDVLDLHGKQKLLHHHAGNIVDIDLPHVPAKELGPAETYEAAADRYRGLLKRGTLHRRETPVMYAYRQTFDFRGSTYQRCGMAATVNAVPFGPRAGGGVLPHEETFSGPKEDRFALMKATKAQLSPVFGLVADDSGDATRIVRGVMASRGPDRTARMAYDNVLHEVWTVEDSATIAAYQRAISAEDIFIADGHHRYTTGLNYIAHLEKSGALSADHPARRSMMVLVGMSDPGLVIGPTHRVLGGMQDYSLDAFIKAAGDRLRFEPIAGDLHALHDAMHRGSATGENRLGLYDFATGRGFVVIPGEPDPLAARFSSKPRAWRQLDVAIIQYLIVESICQPQLNAGRPVKWAFPHSVEEVIDIGKGRETGAGGGKGFVPQIAVLVRPTPLASVRDVSKANELMPQKSTFFYPKLATGLFINPLE